MAKVKKTPAWLTNPVARYIYQSRPGIVLTNWLAQGMLIMLPCEIGIKLAIDLLVIAALFPILSTHIGLSLPGSLIVGFVIAHTVNWSFNGHLFVLLRFLCTRHTPPELFFRYPTAMSKRLEHSSHIMAVAIFGSLARSAVNPASDLDVRVIAKACALSQLVAGLLVVRERALALLMRYPLDIYVATVHEGLDHLRSDEPPVALLDPSGILAQHFPQVISFSQIDVEHSS